MDFMHENVGIFKYVCKFFGKNGNPENHQVRFPDELV